MIAAFVTDAGVKARSSQLIGELHVFLATFRTNQKNPAARNRHQLPNVGHIRRDDSPDAYVQKLLLRIEKSLSDG